MSWKREEIPDHKFDYVDIDEFVDNSWSRKILYSSVFIYALKDILVYMADLGSAVILVASNSDVIFNKGGNGTIVFSPNFNSNSTAKTTSNTIILALGGPLVIFALILASLMASFILLIFEWRKANQIIRSRDISYAFTSEVAYSYYTIRSYPHYCFFSQIQNSRKPVDVLAFWVFFKFRGWKRLILAEFARQFLNSLIVYDIFTATQKAAGGGFIQTLQRIYSPSYSNLDAMVFFSLQIITISIWIFSFLGLVAAFIIYIPLLCNIRGNLKEYCVHKIDKRIEEILKRKTRKRLQEARRQEQERIYYTGDSSMSIQDKDQPTLPNIDVDLDDASTVAYSQHAQYYYGNGYSEYSDYFSEVDSSGLPYQQSGTIPPVPSKYDSSHSSYVYAQRQRSYAADQQSGSGYQARGNQL